MKNNLVTPAAKPRHSMRLFADVVSYRVPLPVTKVIAYSNTTYPVCPRCAVSLDREYMYFCDRCGQKLNWDLFQHSKIIHPVYKKE